MLGTWEVEVDGSRRLEVDVGGSRRNSQSMEGSLGCARKVRAFGRWLRSTKGTGITAIRSPLVAIRVGCGV